MGDAGSTGLGFIVALLSTEFIESRQTTFSPQLALYLFLVPISDTVFVIFYRFFGGKSIFEPSTKHIHHILFNYIGSNNKVLIIIILLSLISTVVGIAFTGIEILWTN